MEYDFDRATVRRQVEDFWRSLMLYGRRLGETRPMINRDEAMRLTAELSRNFHEQNKARASLLPLDRAQAYLGLIEEEDERCFWEHQNDPDGFYRRLGLGLPGTSQIPLQAAYRRRGLGELAVRTAVRATVWEMIRALFRW